MKRLNLIVLTLFLILGQWSSLEHAFHEHQASEVCDYCLSKKPLEHLAVNSIQTFFPTSIPQWQDELTPQVYLNEKVSYFAARAPPRFI